MKFKKWCISSVDTVKETPANAAPEKKGFFARMKSKTDEK
jgi:preprotein translocase subunit YajC